MANSGSLVVKNYRLSTGRLMHFTEAPWFLCSTDSPLFLCSAVLGSRQLEDAFQNDADGFQSPKSLLLISGHYFQLRKPRLIIFCVKFFSSHLTISLNICFMCKF